MLLLLGGDAWGSSWGYVGVMLGYPLGGDIAGVAMGGQFGVTPGCSSALWPRGGSRELSALLTTTKRSRVSRTGPEPRIRILTEHKTQHSNLHRSHLQRKPPEKHPSFFPPNPEPTQTHRYVPEPARVLPSSLPPQ